MSDRVQRIMAQVKNSIADSIIHEWLSTTNSDSKLLALLTIRRKIESNTQIESRYFEIANRFLLDNDSDCKWQAFIIIGYYLQIKPNDCWQIIIDHSNSTDEDTRAAVATILLEHYFEQNPGLFEEKFTELKNLVNEGSYNVIKTLRLCRSNWRSKTNRMAVEMFINQKKDHN